MEKNQLLIFNNTIRELYRCRSYPALRTGFLPALKLLVPFRYGSIMLREERDGVPRLTAPLCLPAEFESAERDYMRFAADDPMKWLASCREPTLIRESDLVAEDHRFRSNTYLKCYQRFHVYDSLQYGIVDRGVPLGQLTLFRCREDGSFSEDDLFLLKAVGVQLNQHLGWLLSARANEKQADLSAVAERYGLTVRERQLLGLLSRFRDNREIAETLQVKEGTLQKHLQNLFRKMAVTSRWEVMRLLMDEGEFV